MKLTHHAYVYEGGAELFPALVKWLRENEGYDLESPDFFARLYEKFGIEEARQLKDTAALKNASGRALFVIGATLMSTEAQQALLKLLEEPQEGAVFVLLIPQGILLPTVRSRCLPFPAMITIENADALPEARMFLKNSPQERTEIVAHILDDEDHIHERAREFLNALERELHRALPMQRDQREIIRGLNAISQFRDYFSDRSPSLKMMLEHLAASLPRV